MTISFKHSYDKLKAHEFTTIRSKAFGVKAETASEIWIERKAPHRSFPAKVLKVETKRICDIPLTLLQADIAPFKIATVGGFLTFLNSLRAPFWSQATLDSEMAIITLRKI